MPNDLTTADSYWKVADYSGSGNLLDLGPNGIDLTVNGTPTHTDNYLTLTTSDWLEAAHNAAFNPGAGSFSALAVWSVDAYGAATQIIMAHRVGLGGDGWMIQATTAPRIRVYVESTSGEVFDQVGGTVAAATILGWGMVRRGTPTDNLEAFGNTAQILSGAPDAATINCDATAPLTIGREDGGTQPTAGKFYGAAFWLGEELTQAEFITATADLQVATPSGSSFSTHVASPGRLLLTG